VSDKRAIEAAFDEISRNFITLKSVAQQVVDAGALLTESVKDGGKILFCGNGGSAADAQHLATELVGRYLKERPPIAAIALTTDTSALTAIANDYAFDAVFERQVGALCRAGDVLVALSTSGKSPNVIKAADAAKTLGARVVALTGSKPNPLAEKADVAIMVPATTSNRIQEMHIAVGHILCGIVEDSVA
jgi:D-sedoheptulose 7-phosphate isomerase